MGRHLPQSIGKGISIGIVTENFPSFDSVYNNMVQRCRGINSGFPWHFCSIRRKTIIDEFVKSPSTTYSVIPAEAGIQCF
jgi:hypothetical protein